MTTKTTFQPCFVFFVLLFIQIVALRNSIWKSYLYSFLVYLLAGGWRYQRIFILTIRRDLKGLKCLLMMCYHTYWNQYTKNTFGDLFAHTVSLRGRDTVAILYEDQQWTFGQLDDYSNKVANLLLQAGFQQGDKLFLLMHSCPAYIGIWLGAAKIGVAVGLLNYNLHHLSLSHCLNALQCKGIVVGSKLKIVFSDIDGESHFASDHVWYVDEVASTADTAQATSTTSEGTWNQALAQVSHTPPPRLIANHNREHVLYVYTSGTTGLPKPAIISTRRYIHFTVGIRYSFDLSTKDVLYTALPLYHTLAGICGVGQMLLFGTTLVIRAKFSASHFWDDCIKYRCTVVQYIGEVCRYLIAQPPRLTDTQHHVRLAYGNGLRREVWSEFQKRFNVPYIGELYGATESNCSISNCDFKVGAVGFIPQTIKCVYPMCLIKMDPVTEEPVRDRDTGFCIECDINEPGQLIGPINDRSASHFFDGYVDKKMSEKKILRNVFRNSDMWFATGDLLYHDELGYLYFNDRLGDTFRWRGENVATFEVETMLLRIDPRALVSVYGVTVPGNEGKAGMAAIMVDFSTLTDNDEENMVTKIQEGVTQHLPTYARPMFLRLCQSVDMTSTFKLTKVELVQSGFDPSNTKDHIYWLDPSVKRYVRLTEETFEKLKAGLICL